MAERRCRDCGVPKDKDGYRLCRECAARRSLTVGSLFSGIGGFDLGLERAGMRVIWHSEIDPYACKVLKKHWPAVPNLGDITQIEWSTVERPDVLCGGFPCQPVSLLGKAKAQADERWLWPAFAAAIDGLRPSYVVIENTPGLRTRGLRDVLADLARFGFDAEWSTLSACAMGATHTRSRLFVVAYPAGRVQPGIFRGEESPVGPAGSGWWSAVPDVVRVANGIPDRVDRVHAVGNGRRRLHRADGALTMAVLIDSKGQYWARCEHCDWVEGPFDDDASAGHVYDLHHGEKHFDD